MTLTAYEKDILKEYSDLSEDEILYELDQSYAYLDAGYSSTFHTDRIEQLRLVLNLRQVDTPHDDCSHWVGNMKEANDA